MIYYLLPNVNSNIYKGLQCIVNDATNIILNPSLNNYLQQIKLKINSHEKEWDIYKKYTNPYEYINTICNIYSLCVSKYKPLSRSFFKMIEIIHVFELIRQTHPIRTFHLAEGPGGFIEAVIRERKNPHDYYVGMTLIDSDNDPNVPSWKKTELFLKQNPNIHIEVGKDGTGNLLNIENFDHVVTKFGNTMDLITADGGFDFSTDFNNQENSIFKLLVAQICYAICTQKKNGVFVLKIFDCFLYNTIDLIYLLSSFYNRVYITKPQTSRYANSEKYLVCKEFNGNIDVSVIRTLLTSVINADSFKIGRLFPFNLPNYFMSKMEEYNAIFGQQQLENINYTLRFIENKTKGEKIESLIHINLSKCVKWCIKHNIEYNTFQRQNCFN